ncbi:hypothetical protein CEXT_636661 [Caerostris extrusa]|uniref:Uncharacterized protein n=1 Tax=Caerostris extrusa TaxID=172846 RepID=A0AAV4QHI0_CAEEX|nr:hypothetical protein CEXT_636661 [Caerostris extrusa]
MVKVSHKVLDEQFLVGRLGFFIEAWVVQLKNQIFHASAFDSFPVVPREIEEERLEKQHEAHPLVIGVEDSFIAFYELIHARINYFHTNFFLPSMHNTEGRVHPAKIVQYRSCYGFIRYAVDGVAKVLSGGDQDTETKQSDGGGFVMEAEDVVVDDSAAGFEEALQI